MEFVFKDITTVSLKKFYNNFQGEKTFLQTPKYGRLRKKMGETNFIKGIFLEKKLIGVVQIQKIKAKRGTYLHIPHGPLISPSFLKNEVEGGFYIALRFFLEEYKKLGKQEKCDFVRISPLLSEDKSSVFWQKDFRPAPVHLVNPELTWVLDLTQSEEDLLANMRKSTRYEIRRIKKSDIKVCIGNTKKDLDVFWELHMQTVARQKFVPFPKKMTQIELSIFKEDAKIFSAYKEDEFYSSSIILFDEHAAYYHQGSSKRSKLPFSYATLWEAILSAKKWGLKEFNFWGVCEENNKYHPWFGLSRFKRGFGGEERRYMHVQDYPITKKYWLNWAIEKYRKWKKRY